MATISRPYKLVNPGRRRNRRRNMTPKQIKFFGTKRQRAALKANRKRRTNRRKRNVYYHKKLKEGVYEYGIKPRGAGRRRNRSRRRKRNVGSILTVFNPGGKNVARRRRRNRRKSTGLFFNRRRRHNRRRRTNARRRHNRRVYVMNPPRRRRRHNVRHRRRRNWYNRGRRRRNPDFMSGMSGKLIGVFGGAAVTKLITETLGGMVSMLSSGIPLYIAGAVVAMLQGKFIGKLAKSPSLGQDMEVGGYVYVLLKVMTDLLPSIPLPFGLSGMGLITTSGNWGPPWVPVNTSMTRFVRPGGVVAAIPPPAPPATPGMSGFHGVGRLRRFGRLA